MDIEIQKKLVKQLKLLNFWVSFFGSLFIIGMIITGILLYKVVAVVRHTTSSINNLQTSTTEKLDVKDQVCNGTGAFSEFVKNKTNACD